MLNNSSLENAICPTTYSSWYCLSSISALEDEVDGGDRYSLNKLTIPGSYKMNDPRGAHWPSG